MNIAIDYDGTITNDPDTFEKVIKNFRDAGHKVYIVTQRYVSELFYQEGDRPAITHKWDKLVDGIYATGRMGKKAWMSECTDIQIDVWMDDTPLSILKDTQECYRSTTPEGLTGVKQPDSSVNFYAKGVLVDKTDAAVSSMREIITTPNAYTIFVFSPTRFFNTLESFSTRKDKALLLWLFSCFTPVELDEVFRYVGRQELATVLNRVGLVPNDLAPFLSDAGNNFVKSVFPKGTFKNNYKYANH